jgi:hypothetical protein
VKSRCASWVSSIVGRMGTDLRTRRWLREPTPGAAHHVIRDLHCWIRHPDCRPCHRRPHAQRAAAMDRGGRSLPDRDSHCARRNGHPAKGSGSLRCASGALRCGNQSDDRMRQMQCVEPRAWKECLAIRRDLYETKSLVEPLRRRHVCESVQPQLGVSAAASDRNG